MTYPFYRCSRRFKFPDRLVWHQIPSNSNSIKSEIFHWPHCLLTAGIHHQVWLRSWYYFPLQYAAGSFPKYASKSFDSTFYFKRQLVFQSSSRKKVVGVGEEIWSRNEVPTPGCMVIYYKSWFFLSLSLSIIYLFRELETGKQPWRFSSYLNRTVLGLCTLSAVIGNHSYHAPIFQRQYNAILWPMNQGFPLSQCERLGPGRTGRKISLRHSFSRRKLTKENLVSEIFNCILK